MRTILSSHLLPRSVATVAVLGMSLVPLAAQSAQGVAAASSSGNLVVADAHSYRHCHNIFTRTYCHKADRLPQNWPPNTDTPHRGKRGTDMQKECPEGSTRCGSNVRSSKG